MEKKNIKAFAIGVTGLPFLMYAIRELIKAFKDKPNNDKKNASE